MNSPADLFAAIAAAPRLPGAACVGKHAIFDLRDADAPDRPEAEAEALTLCAACPALTACQAHFDGLPDRLRPTGIVGGVVRRPAAPGRPRGRPKQVVT
jgi:hypothetical protein